MGILVTLTIGFMSMVMLVILVIFYAFFGSLIGDQMKDLGFSYRDSVTAALVTPGLLFGVIYVLGDFVLGVILSGGLH